jgi:hexokinase
MPVIFILLLTFIVSCSHLEEPHNPEAPKEFSAAELILGTELLSKIFDMEMAPLSCVPDTEEASLLLRTIKPRMDVVQEDMEAMLEDQAAVGKLINNCNKNCTCTYVDDLLRENLVSLSKEQQNLLDQKKSPEEVNRCMNYTRSTFCESELYKELSQEKSDFSFEEDPL